MSPDGQLAQTSILTPPKLTSNRDQYQWRTYVKILARIVKLYAKGGDTRAKGMINALGLTLNLSMSRDLRSIVDNAVQNHEVTFKL